MTIGKRILKKRKELALTQYQLAQRINVNIKSVKDWENDVSCPSASTIVKLCDLLNVSADYLLGLRHNDPIFLDEFSLEDQMFIRSFVKLMKTHRSKHP